MKKTFYLIPIAVLVGLLLAVAQGPKPASEGGVPTVSWDMEMQRPEARKALQKYVEDNCFVTLWYPDVPTEHGNVMSRLKLRCPYSDLK